MSKLTRLRVYPNVATEPLTIDHPAFDVIQETTDWYEKNSHARYLRDAGMSKKGDDLIQCDRGDLLHIECADGHRRTVAYSCNQRFHPECQEQNLKAAMLRYNHKLEYLKNAHQGRVITIEFDMHLGGMATPQALTADNAKALRSSYRRNIELACRIVRYYRNHKDGQVPYFHSLHCRGVRNRHQLFSLFLFVPKIPDYDLLHKIMEKCEVVGEVHAEGALAHMMHHSFERHLKVLEPEDDEEAAANEIVSFETRSLRPHTYVPIPKTIDPDLFPEEEPTGNNQEVEKPAAPVAKSPKCNICGKPCTVRMEYRLHGRLREGYLDRLAPSD